MERHRARDPAGRRHARAIHADGDPRFLVFTLAGRSRRYPAGMRVCLDALREGRTATVGELVARGRETLGEPLTRALLGTLIKDGLVFIVRRTPD